MSLPDRPHAPICHPSILGVTRLSLVFLGRFGRLQCFGFALCIVGGNMRLSGILTSQSESGGAYHQEVVCCALNPARVQYSELFLCRLLFLCELRPTDPQEGFKLSFRLPSV